MDIKEEGNPVEYVPNMPAEQAVYWILTISCESNTWTPPCTLPSGLVYLRGQREIGEGGFEHYQVMVAFAKKVTRARVLSIFGACHAEPTRSQSARDYVWKEETRVEGTQFELGRYPHRRNAKTDWEEVRRLAQQGCLETVPADVYVRHYSALRRIGQDHLQPVAMERTCAVFWGRTGTGKSRRAWSEAGMEAYPKSSTSKFWDGYRGHEHVVMDEFRGRIGIEHLLTWLDRYPVIVEVKGSSTVLRAKRIWITSNVHPQLWYPELDRETFDALARRLEITEFQ